MGWDFGGMATERQGGTVGGRTIGAELSLKS
jgi:hypothetical protein